MHSVTKQSIELYFKDNEEQKCKYTNSLSALKETMKKEGGEDELVMFLSGMGGTGKSKVIKAFVHFAKGISLLFDWNYDSDTVQITALTGVTVC